MDKQIDLVIAYYNEVSDFPIFIDYINKYNYNLKLYNKGTQLPCMNKLNTNYDVYNIKNIGQHTHTYLYHIINNYDNLSDITIFMLGSAFRDNKKEKKARWLLDNARECSGFMAQHIWLSDKNDYNFELPYYGIFNYNNNNNINSNSQRIITKMIRSDIYPLGKWIQNFLNFNITNKQFYRSNKCMFAVTKDIILKKPLIYWNNLIKQFETKLICRNLEVIHYFERAWICVFIESDKDDKYYKKILNYDKKKYGYLY